MVAYKLKFTPEAVQDMIEAIDYYELQKHGLGKRFRSYVRAKLTRIKESPLLYAVKYEDVRFALIDFFPYSIHFSVDPDSRAIQVHAILCQYRDPMKFWKGFKD